ncbi:ABC transporter permease [Paenibacillus hemerocallicola]|uniref:ABC transporter permease n=1 Tax=Paenibacillus hemerocallicola TaxID=1172614 RepID=A0A5C4TEW5_9BACL|nr:ABC transporter permease [Paenibacillus hemerocallicola]
MCCPFWEVAPVTLFDVAKKNVKGNLKHYLMYLISMISSVVIFFTFVSLQYSDEIRAGLESSESVRAIFAQASYLLMLFMAIFIWYSNSFFTKKRKKEVGLYSLLGVRKKTIARMLFYENVMMGAVALVAGIVLGTFLSKLFAMLFLRLMDSAVQVGVVFSFEALVHTTIVFAAMVLLTSVQGYRLIYRFKLIELFQAEKEGEVTPKPSFRGAAAAVALLAAGYWVMWQPIVTTGQYMRNLLFVLVVMVAGTYLLFRFVTVALLQAAKRSKSRYYRGINMIGTAQLMYRIQGNARVLTIISLLSAVTLSAGCVGYSMYYSNGKTAALVSPFSLMHVSKGEAFDAQVRSVLEQDREHPVELAQDLPVIKAKGVMTRSDILPPRYSREDDNPVKLIAASTYNKIQTELGRTGNVRLKGDEALGIKPMYTNYTSADYAGEALALQLPGGTRNAAFVGMTEERVLNWSFPDYMVIVSDEAFEDMSRQIAPIVYKAYKIAREQSMKQTSERLYALDAELRKLPTFYTEYRKGLEEAGINLFTLGFLGLVFLAATGSIIYFKQLTEAHSDKERYAILRKIGVRKKEVGLSVAKQTGFIFALPLAVGLLHCGAILKAITTLYGSVSEVNLTVPIASAMLVYLLLYCGYYALTVRSYNKIVNG